MDNVRRDSMKMRLDRVHRAGAALFGLGIAVFGVLGLADRLRNAATPEQLRVRSAS
jgi:hypothetical protein